MALLLKNALIVSSNGIKKNDIRIDNGKFVAVGECLQPEGCTVRDLNELHVFAGGIDVHTHFALDVGTTVTADDFSTGTRAALAGGTTTIIDFVNHIKGETFHECLAHYRTLSDNKCFCDYGFHLGISDWNAALSHEFEQMLDLGITTFKMYMAYKNVLQVSDEQIEQALLKAKSLGVLLSFHCEDGDAIAENVQALLSEKKLSPHYHPLSRTDSVEFAAVKRLIDISDKVQYPVYIVHVSSKRALDEICQRRKNGSQVIAETCPQYLLLNDSVYEGTPNDAFAGAKYVISPPLRKITDNNALWNALKNGDITVLATDHCSFNYKKQKELGRNDFSKIPNGGPGVEHRLQLAYTYGVAKNRLSLEQFAVLTAENPAKIFGLFPQKGIIQAGSDADFFIAHFGGTDTITAKNHYQNVDYTPYEGFDAKLVIQSVFLRGKEVVKNGTVLQKLPEGTFIRRKKYSER